MMHVTRAKYFLPVLMIIIGCISCENKQAALPQQRYYYYPKTNIYYDANSLEYIYSLDSARTWVKLKSAPGQNASAILGDQVSIKETDDDIWFENELHRNMYGGTLYNLVTQDTALLSDKTKEVKKTDPKQNAEANTPKKKRNIFQKIFGKKNNKI